MITEKPEALMIHMPEDYFNDGVNKEELLRRYYETMGYGNHEADCFYHFISSIPVHDVTHVFVCFKGHVQYKAILVDKLRNQRPYPDWECRHYLVTTGPVIKAPEGMVQRGFRGFRYCRMLF
jgi:hypothetical protein